jgi:hypothetical protein
MLASKWNSLQDIAVCRSGFFAYHVLKKLRSEEEEWVCTRYMMANSVWLMPAPVKR